jgi:hypothetical protein
MVFSVCTFQILNEKAKQQVRKKILCLLNGLYLRLCAAAAARWANSNWDVAGNWAEVGDTPVACCVAFGARATLPTPAAFNAHGQLTGNRYPAFQL